MKVRPLFIVTADDRGRQDATESNDVSYSLLQTPRDDLLGDWVWQEAVITCFFAYFVFDLTTQILITEDDQRMQKQKVLDPI